MRPIKINNAKGINNKPISNIEVLKKRENIIYSDVGVQKSKSKLIR